jgi:uncharacterized integral membrane protein (TIGR00698 family)
MNRSRLGWPLFVCLLVFVLSPWASPSIALVLGIAFALTCEHPCAGKARAAAKPLLQAGVVGLGFGMNLHRVLQVGASGAAYTAGGIAFSMGLGILLGRLLRVRETTAYLISTGTAVCGGSAIAAVGPVLGADEEEMSVSLGTVFVLNAVALLIFPAVGRSLRLTQEQFGLWAALAIHDTSSVVGATVKYGAAALAVGTTVKLARALWIVPMSLGTAAWRRSKAKVQWPWFVLFFALAAGLNTSLPHPFWATLNALGKISLTVTLFLIGSGISAGALRKVGTRPLLLGVILWLVVSCLSLGLIVSGVIR